MATLIAPAGVSQVAGPGGPYLVAADGTVVVPNSLVNGLLGAGFQFIGQQVDTQYFLCPPTADLVSIVAAVLPVSGTPFTIALQPAHACKLQVRGVYSGAVAGLVVNLVGTDGRGNAVTETVNVAAASSTTFLTVNAYAKLTSATPVGTVTNVTTIGIGQSSALALALPPAFVDLVVFKESMATAGTAVVPADEAVGTVDTVAGTLTPSSAPNAAKCYHVSYAWTTVA
jgi:hypothetical protein